MITPDYSLTTVVTDGFTAPRWVHYAVKLATGGLVVGLLLPFLAHLLAPASLARLAIACAVLSLCWFLSLHVHYWLDHRADIGASPPPLFSRDLLCDASLHVAPCAIVFALAGLGAVALILFTVCVTGFAANYPWATP